MIIQVVGILFITIFTNDYKEKISNKFYSFASSEFSESNQKNSHVRKITSIDSPEWSRPASSNLRVSPKRLKISFFENIKYIMNFKRKNSKIAELNKAYDRINRKLDILFIIKKFTELEKIKMLLLDEDQLRLFNHLPKPIFCIDSKKMREPTSRDKSEFLSMWEAFFDFDDYRVKRSDKKQSLRKAYDNLILKTEKTGIDRKLIEIFEAKKLKLSGESVLDDQQIEKSQKVIFEEL